MLYFSVLEVRSEAWSYGYIFYPGSYPGSHEAIEATQW